MNLTFTKLAYACFDRFFEQVKLFDHFRMAFIFLIGCHSTHIYVRFKLRSEIVWHRFFAVPAFIRHFRSYIAVRKLLV